MSRVFLDETLPLQLLYTPVIYTICHSINLTSHPRASSRTCTRSRVRGIKPMFSEFKEFPVLNPGWRGFFTDDVRHRDCPERSLICYSMFPHSEVSSALVWRFHENFREILVSCFIPANLHSPENSSIFEKRDWQSWDRRRVAGREGVILVITWFMYISLLNCRYFDGGEDFSVLLFLFSFCLNETLIARVFKFSNCFPDDRWNTSGFQIISDWRAAFRIERQTTRRVLICSAPHAPNSVYMFGTFVSGGGGRGNLREPVFPAHTEQATSTRCTRPEWKTVTKVTRYLLNKRISALYMHARGLK